MAALSEAPPAPYGFVGRQHLPRGNAEPPPTPGRHSPRWLECSAVGRLHGSWKPLPVTGLTQLCGGGNVP